MGWNDVKSNDNNNKEIKYFKPQNGMQIIRLLDQEPFTRWVHWIQSANKGKGVSIDCIGDGCPICADIKREKDAGVKNTKYNSRKTHSINVFVKKQGTIDVNEAMVLEKGNNAFIPIKDAMAVCETMGMGSDLRKVDLLMQISGKADKPNYSVNPLQPSYNQNTTPDGKPFDELEKYDCTALKPTLTADQIVELMNGASLDEVTGNTKEETNSDGDLVLE